MANTDLISDDYRRQQEQMHENPQYGVASIGYAKEVAHLANACRARELLDYGAGKGNLGKYLPKYLGRPIELYHYEPAMPEWSATPEPRKLVCCIDVLEHVEPDKLDSVLRDLKRVTDGIGFFTVHVGPAKKKLPDGRNAHLIQRDFRWWLPRIWEFFDIDVYRSVPGGFVLYVGRRETA